MSEDGPEETTEAVARKLTDAGLDYEKALEWVESVVEAREAVVLKSLQELRDEVFKSASLNLNAAGWLYQRFVNDLDLLIYKLRRQDG